MKQITKSLISYIAEECNQDIPDGPAMGDLKLIATDSDFPETLKAGSLERTEIELGSSADYTTQLLKMVILAAINSPRAVEYLTRIPTFSTSSQAALKDIIEEVQNPSASPRRTRAEPRQIQDHRDHDNSDASAQRKGHPSYPEPDPELLFEERLGRIMAENANLGSEKKKLQTEFGELKARLNRLQENNVSKFFSTICTRGANGLV